MPRYSMISNQINSGFCEHSKIQLQIQIVIMSCTKQAFHGRKVRLTSIKPSSESEPGVQNRKAQRIRTEAY